MKGEVEPHGFYGMTVGGNHMPTHQQQSQSPIAMNGKGKFNESLKETINKQLKTGRILNESNFNKFKAIDF